MQRRLVIFDCDGTLVDSQNIIVAAMEMAFAEAGLDAPARASVLSIVGLSLPEAITRLTLMLDLSPEPTAIERITQGYKNAFTTLRQDPAHDEPMFAGAREALAQLAARDDIALGIATGKSRRGVERLLRREGLIDCFHTIQTADDAPSKPHPAMVEQAMADIGVAPEATTMIGDTTFDMEMARRACARAIGVSWGYHPVAMLSQAGAHYVAEDYPALMGLLDAPHHAGRAVPVG
ncbi:MAG: HAD family hydrolase [Alphaproteobacteria bacterium]|nr:MAG: HAD family hydrolase [Alphaproteobacteria bacterium]